MLTMKKASVPSVVDWRSPLLKYIYNVEKDPATDQSRDAPVSIDVHCLAGLHSFPRSVSSAQKCGKSAHIVFKRREWPNLAILYLRFSFLHVIRVELIYAPLTEFSGGLEAEFLCTKDRSIWDGINLSLRWHDTYQMLLYGMQMGGMMGTLPIRRVLHHVAKSAEARGVNRIRFNVLKY